VAKWMKMADKNPDWWKRFWGDPTAEKTMKEIGIECKKHDSNQCHAISIKYELKINPRSMKNTLERLKKMNLIKLVQDKNDNRKIIIILTEDGKKLTRNGI
jgi:DNA-binding MarR family transcriptional regulator